MARLPATRTLRALATRRQEDYRVLWRQSFDAAVQAVSPTQLRAALRSRLLLDAERTVMDTWAQQVEAPLRQRLPLLMEDTVGAVMTSAQLPQPTRSLLRLPGVQQRIAEQVGTEIVSVTRTTLRTVRQVLRAGWQGGASPATLATRLRYVIGLTPQQERRIATLRVQWQAVGLPPREVNRLARQARAVALHQRALLIARTESITAANLGAYETLQALAQQGSLVSASLLRRTWVTTGASCPICAAIPGMNPDGVPLGQPFQTPNGPRFYPAVHPGCNCTISAYYSQEG